MAVKKNKTTDDVLLILCKSVKKILSKTTKNDIQYSPMVQKIKSVVCAGTKSNFVCVPFKNPFPINPPEPIAIFD